MSGCPNDISDCPVGKQDATDRRKFHIYRGISVETILALATILAGFGTWMMHEDSRIASAETQIINLKETDKGIQSRITGERSEMRDDIKEIKEQVNKLVERRR